MDVTTCHALLWLQTCLLHGSLTSQPALGKLLSTRNLGNLKGVLFVSIRSIAGKFNLPCLKQKKCSRKPEARHVLMRAFYGDVRE